MRSGGVIVEKLVPVMSEVKNGRNIRGHNRAQETQHFVRECDLLCDTETNVVTSVALSQVFTVTTGPGYHHNVDIDLSFRRY